MTEQHPLTGTAGALQAFARIKKEHRETMERLAQPMTHPLTDEICDQITDELSIFSIEDCMRDAYDVGYAQALEDVQDVITCIQRKDSPSRPVSLEELEAMRPQQENI